MFTMGALAAQFDDSIAAQAKSGRIAFRLRQLADTLDGMSIPEGKEAFLAHTVEFNNSSKPKGMKIERALAYSAAFNAIREIMGFKALAPASWAIAHADTQKKAAATRATNKRAEDKKATKRAADITAATITAADITAAITAGVFSETELNTIITAARSMLPALV